jgi:hypothetical protein
MAGAAMPAARANTAADPAIRDLANLAISTPRISADLSGGALSFAAEFSAQIAGHASFRQGPAQNYFAAVRHVRTTL